MTVSRPTLATLADRVVRRVLGPSGDPDDDARLPRYWPEGRRMTVDEVRGLISSFEAVTESTPFAPDRPVFKDATSGRVFAILSGHERPDQQITVKVPPDRVDQLLSEYRSAHTAYKLNKRHWVNLSLEGDIPDDILSILIIESYWLVRSRG